MNSNETLTSTQPYNLPNYRPIDQLVNLDYHIVHSCNLACYGCNHWTDIYSLKGQIPAEIYETEVRQWVNKLLEVDLQYKAFNILGGEPLMHSNLMQILDYTVDIFKNTTTSVGLVTNGLLWHKYPTLFEYCLDNKIRIRLSVHVDNKEFIKQLTPILNDFKKYKIPLSRMKVSNASLRKSYGDGWRLTRNKNLQPFYSDPKKA